MKDRILFSQFWMLRKLGKYRDAITAGQILKANTQDPFDVNRYSFWLGRSYQDAGLNVDAHNEFNLLKAADALGYYGMLTYYQLNENLPALPAINGNLNLKALDKDQRRNIQALTLANELSILENYLDEKTKVLKDHRVDVEVQLAYLKAYAAAGLYLPLFNLIGTLEPAVRARLLDEHPEFLFPKKYSDLIENAGSKFNVSPELMLAIIRQESAFNTFARSPADAFGLMQLLPRVAMEQQPLTGIHIKSAEDLYIPEINIISGAALLSQLGKKYHGRLILEAAAYNASEQAIENWLKTRMRNDTLEFIEDIPYDETRGYIKLVLRNFIFYSRLRQPQNSMPFPRACLEDLQSFKVSTD
jgi:soluble lytic murein transglycosylase